MDECVFYRGKTVYILYTDDSILAGPDPEEIEQVLKDLKKENFEVTDEGNIEDVLGVNIERKEGKIKLSQPHLIEQFINDLGLNQDKVHQSRFQQPPLQVVKFSYHQYLVERIIKCWGFLMSIWC